MSDQRDIDLGVTVRGFTPGQRVFSRYELVRLLGRGGMGMVWLARDEQLRREIALKFLPELIAADPTSIDDLKRETSRSLDLTHPHIVRVHDFITDGSLAAISMEFVPGRTLAELRLQQPKRIFDAAELTDWMTELCEALTYAHIDASVVHRDLKPSNLMVDARRRLKVTDFGIAATVSDTVTRVSRVASSGGTPAYASPQQLMGEAPSPADDIYAVGATLYELLTSKPPFYSGNLLLQVQTRRPPALAARRAELRMEGAPIPAEWEHVVAACLEKQREERPASISEIARRLGLTPAAPAPLIPGKANDEDFALTVVGFARTNGAVEAPPEAREEKSEVPVISAPARAQGQAPAQAEAPALPVVPPVRRVAVESPAVKKREEPAPPPPPPVPRTRSSRWVLVTLGLAAAGVALWLGDVPNRALALWEDRKGHQATIAADWAGAMDHFRKAATRRPTDAALRSRYAEAQDEWLENLRNDLARLSPQQAFAALTPEVLATGRQMSADFRDEFQALVDQCTAGVRNELRLALVRIEARAGLGELAEARAELEALQERAVDLPEYAETLRRVQETEVRQAIDAALKETNSGNFAGALTRLEQAAAPGLLSGDIEDARALVRQRAATGNVDRLGQAIRGGRPEDVRTVLESGADAPPDPSAVARQLVEARTLESFQDAMRAAGFDATPAAGARRPVHILAETLRERFSDAPAVARFLAGSYTAWARDLLAAQQPGFALYALERARLEGGAEDTELLREARAAAGAALGLTLLLAPTVQAAREAPVPSDDLRAAAREIIQRSAGDWVNLVELRPVGERRPPLELRTRISAVETQDQATEKTDRVRYERGSEAVRNPEYDQTATALEQAQREALEHERQLRQMQRGGDNEVVNAFQGILSIQVRAKMEAAQRRERDLRKKLSEIPETVRSPVYDFETYRIITHNRLYSASLTTTLHRETDELAPWTVFEAGLPHETREVVGNQARGVPVERPKYPDANEVAKKLGADLARQVSADPDLLLTAVESATFTALGNQLVAENASAAVAADRRWALARLWRLSGQGVSQTPELERAVRVHLGLPATSVGLPSGPAPTVVSLGATAGKSAGPSPAVANPEQRAAASSGGSRPAETLVHRVRSGETLAKIAARFDVTLAALRAANPEVDPRRLTPGQELVIPRE